MKRFYLALILLAPLCLLALCAASGSAGRPAQPTVTAVLCGRLFDPKTGNTISPAVVTVEGDRIKSVAQGRSVIAGARVIDLSQMTVMPGLIDAHTHITYHFDPSGHFGMTSDPRPAVETLYAAENARKTVEAGFTTIRNLGAGEMIDIDLRDAIGRGEVPGPRILASGEPLTPNSIPPAGAEASRLAAIREFVRARVREGADVIKIFEGVDERGAPLFSEADIRAAVEEAARSNRRVAVHAHEAAAVKVAVRAGCASIEHGSFLDDEAIRLMVEHHTALVPTLYLPTHYIEHKSQFPFGESTWEFFERLRSHNLDNARKAMKAGVRIVAGSDAVAGLHGNNAREIEWLVKAGLTPAEAIRAATTDAAALLGIDDRAGSIEAGKLADIIAVAGDPTRDITELQRVRFVMKAGNVIVK